jgi:hypothetical protein
MFTTPPGGSSAKVCYLSAQYARPCRFTFPHHSRGKLNENMFARYTGLSKSFSPPHPGEAQRKYVILEPGGSSTKICSPGILDYPNHFHHPTRGEAQRKYVILALSMPGHADLFSPKLQNLRMCISMVIIVFCVSSYPEYCRLCLFISR